jgi:hypothetical protein
MLVDAEIECLIHQQTEEQQIREYLTQTDFTSLRDEGLKLVEEGKTSLEEILRVSSTDKLPPEHEESRNPGQPASRVPAPTEAEVEA